MIIARTANELRKAFGNRSKSVGFVPTMGALHDGHLSLVELARKNSELVVVSIFVNPLQFSAGEDFEKYPRVLEGDIEILQKAKVNVLFAPTVEEIYPAGQVITQHAGKLGAEFEGKIRPGHFDGMLTVVDRLFELVEPDTVVFGQKDAQQIALVRKLLTEKKYGGKTVRLVVGPTLREESGLALSSRNRYLSETERAVATSLSRALFAAQRASSYESAIMMAKKTLDPEARLEYLELVDESFVPVGPDFQGDALMILACKVGSTRLIDNHFVHIEREA